VGSHVTGGVIAVSGKLVIYLPHASSVSRLPQDSVFPFRVLAASWASEFHDLRAIHSGVEPTNRRPDQERAVVLIDQLFHLQSAQNQLPARDSIQPRNSGCVLLHACSVIESGFVAFFAGEFIVIGVISEELELATPGVVIGFGFDVAHSVGDHRRGLEMVREVIRHGSRREITAADAFTVKEDIF
jgi:hypothetical protein